VNCTNPVKTSVLPPVSVSVIVVVAGSVSVETVTVVVSGLPVVSLVASS